MKNQEPVLTLSVTDEAMPKLATPPKRHRGSRALLATAALTLLPASCSFDDNSASHTDRTEATTPVNGPPEEITDVNTPNSEPGDGISEHVEGETVNVKLSNYEESYDVPFGTQDETDISKQLFNGTEAIEEVRKISHSEDIRKIIETHLGEIYNPELKRAVMDCLTVAIMSEIDLEASEDYKSQGRQNELADLLLYDGGAIEGRFAMYDWARAAELKTGLEMLKEWMDGGYYTVDFDKQELSTASYLLGAASKGGALDFNGDSALLNETTRRTVNNVEFLSAAYTIIGSLENNDNTTYFGDLDLHSPTQDEQALADRIGSIFEQIKTGVLTPQQNDNLKEEVKGIFTYLIDGTLADAGTVLDSLQRPNAEEISQLENEAYNNLGILRSTLIRQEVDGLGFSPSSPNIPNDTEISFTGVKGVGVFDVSMEDTLQWMSSNPDLEFEGQPVAGLFAEIRVINGKMRVIYPEGAVVPEEVRNSIEQAAVESSPFLITAFEAGNLNVVRFIMPPVIDEIGSVIPDYYAGSTMRNGRYINSLGLIDIEIYGNGSISQGNITGTLRHEGTHAAFQKLFSQQTPISEETFNQLENVCIALEGSYASGLEDVMDSMVPQLEILRDAIDPQYRDRFTELIIMLEQDNFSEALEADTDSIQRPYVAGLSTAADVICSGATPFEGLIISASEEFDTYSFLSAYTDLENPELSSTGVVKALKTYENTWEEFIEEYSVYSTFKEGNFILGTIEDTKEFGHPYDNANEAIASLISALSDNPRQFAERVKALGNPEDIQAVVELVRFTIDRARELSPELAGLAQLEADFLAELHS